MRPPSVRNRGSPVSSISMAIWKWWPGVASWKVMAAILWSGRSSGW